MSGTEKISLYPAALALFVGAWATLSMVHSENTWIITVILASMGALLAVVGFLGDKLTGDRQGV